MVGFENSAVGATGVKVLADVLASQPSLVSSVTGAIVDTRG